MAQMFKEKGATSGPKMTDEEVYKQVTDYNAGAYKPKPTAQPAGQTQRNVVSDREFKIK